MKDFNLQEALAEYNFLGGLYEGIMRQNVQNTQRLQKDDKSIPALALKDKLTHDMKILQPKIQELHNKLIEHYKEVWSVEQFKFL